MPIQHDTVLFDADQFFYLEIGLSHVRCITLFDT